MTVAELQAILRIESDDDAVIKANRKRVEAALPHLAKRFTPISQNGLDEFQREWGERIPVPSFADFVRAQNMVIDGMIQLEVSALGFRTRQHLRLDPLGAETELAVGAEQTV